MARTKLHGIKLDEVSLVGKGDNPGAHVILLKTKKEEILTKGKDYSGKDASKVLKDWADSRLKEFVKDDGEAATFSELIQDKELRDKIWGMVWTLEDSISSIMYDDTVTDKNAMIQESVDQFKTAITSITKGGSEDMARKMEEVEKELKESQEKGAAVQKELDEVKKENVELKEQVEKAKETIGVDENGICKACGSKAKKEEIDKSALPESVVKKLNEQEARIVKMEEEGIERECISKAAEVGVVGESADVVKVLKAAKKAGIYDDVVKVLTQADARIRKGGLFNETGKDNGDNTITALDKINKLAEEMAAEKGISKEKAFTIVYDTNHDLRKQYIDERSK